ncbi:MAG: DNA repair protein RecN [Cytophagales bacterium]|nr:DNA repair protein RecN [Cytophagales bacterium]
MIQSLSIRNYALIEALELRPESSLNIITGETGAGKSILLGAIGLLLGKRADVKVLYDASQKCVVEGIFEVEQLGLQSLFETADLDYEAECVIRREISPTGKSRAFVNDTPVTLDVLKELGIKLVDVHSQHESLALGNSQFQLQTLDKIAQHDELLNTYQEQFKSYANLQKELEQLRRQSLEASKDLDYQKFILQELNEAKLEVDEQAELEKELHLLEHAEEIKEKLTGSVHLLDESDASILNKLREVSQLIGKIADLKDNLQSMPERLESCSIELKDIVDELATTNEQINFDPERALFVKERLDLIFRLQQKHGVTEIDGLLELQEKLSTELEGFENSDERIKQLTEQVAKAKELVLKKGKKLTASRQKTANALAKQIVKIIQTIGIENGELKISLSEQDPSVDGLDAIEFLFSANKGIDPKPLKSVASGGEFSRLIFAIKSVLAQKTAMPTVIFDEIDTGVSGEVAIQMVKMMRAMADRHQIISISHLPQFAAAARQHYFVYKDHEAARSISRIKVLDNEERISNIAKMIGGNNPSTMAQESARELVEELGSFPE